MSPRAPLPDLIVALRLHHDLARHHAARGNDPLNPFARYDRERADEYGAFRDDLIAQIGCHVRHGISPLFTLGVDRNAQIDAFIARSSAARKAA